MLKANQLIQNNFSKAAFTYLDNAKIQADPALRITEKLYKYKHNDLILDLGSGPGTMVSKQNITHSTINFDLSLPMLKMSDNKINICGDAHNLPFMDNSFELIISNLMVQWSSDKYLLFNEIRRVLKPKGKFIFTTLIKPSLFEMQNAWKHVDNHEHTITFLDQKTYMTNLISSGFIICESEIWENTIYFTNIYNLLNHFKHTGTSLPKAKCSKGLGGKQKLNNLKLFYEKLRTPLGLPLTYRYLLTIANKES